MTQHIYRARRGMLAGGEGDQVPSQPDLNEVRRLSKQLGWATLAIGALCAYLVVELLLGEVVYGITIRLVHITVIVMTFFASIRWLLGCFHKQGRISQDRLQDLTSMSAALLLALMATDTVYTVYVNITTPNAIEGNVLKVFDARVSTREGIPYRYYPAKTNFMIHKANVSIEYDAYGDLYHPEVMASPRIAAGVLELNRVLYSIDEHGLRNSVPLKKARVFALGDSFVFGVSVTQSKTWVARLQQEVGEPVYNLGVSGNSPNKQLMILKYMLETKPESIKLRHLLWMIFEGNDLEDAEELRHPVVNGDQSLLVKALTGTVVDSIASVPALIKQHAVINRIMRGRISLGGPLVRTNGYDPYNVDGVRLAYPVYHSPKYGFRLFYPQYLENVGKGQVYVRDHPNRARLDETFRDMAAVSRKVSFKVTVVIAPSAARIYGRYFENFPPVSAEPYFINYVEQLSRSVGFDVINLYPLMEPYAAVELLYGRADTHWNERGSKVVADIIAKHFLAAERRLN